LRGFGFGAFVWRRRCCLAASDAGLLVAFVFWKCWDSNSGRPLATQQLLRLGPARGPHRRPPASPPLPLLPSVGKFYLGPLHPLGLKWVLAGSGVSPGSLRNVRSTCYREAPQRPKPWAAVAVAEITGAWADVEGRRGPHCPLSLSASDSRCDTGSDVDTCHPQTKWPRLKPGLRTHKAGSGTHLSAS
jgi:hypothetical protein